MSPGVTHYSNAVPTSSRVPPTMTEQIPIVAPVRERVVEFGRSGLGDSRGPDGQCTPDCPETASFPWTIKINGEAAHSMNANRISLLIPKPGEIEHWTYINGGGGWDHPIHLHFEEGVTMDRGGAPIPATEQLVRKDVWRLARRGPGQVPGPVRRVRRLLRQPLPQHGARGLRHADAHPVADRRGRIAADDGDADAKPDRRTACSSPRPRSCRRAIRASSPVRKRRFSRRPQFAADCLKQVPQSAVCSLQTADMRAVIAAGEKQCDA